jgi:hypothetical protein
VVGRTPQQALDSLVQPLQRALSCVCDGVLLASGVRNSSERHGIRLAHAPQRLRAAEFLALIFDGEYQFDCEHQIAETSDPGGSWRVTALGYRCALHDAEHEILAYHWHPLTRGGPSFPHLHLSAGARVAHARLTTAHLPTGLVHLEDVLRLAIETFDARPVRADWDRVLISSKAASSAAWS